ncbi:hypothetical protein DAPPUDRAFT_317878 [Daphnia pulex]|uniref:DUF6729 domain-containing protein n=1 Tax=Daphnia pulex TaxID=6669 RepID=E9GH85_DAPPU|nr:hypothetical protein DAPPUDRAFT_317878 [Daphnia pulex]|eukprot:EFX81153.1 hypothetical protein DAPPUDRAFT_317878 [Daphnia pulex]
MTVAPGYAKDILVPVSQPSHSVKSDCKGGSVSFTKPLDTSTLPIPRSIIRSNDYSHRLPSGWLDTVGKIDQQWIGQNLSSRKGTLISNLKTWWYPPSVPGQLLTQDLFPKLYNRVRNVIDLTCRYYIGAEYLECRWCRKTFIFYDARLLSLLPDTYQPPEVPYPLKRCTVVLYDCQSSRAKPIISGVLPFPEESAGLLEELRDGSSSSTLPFEKNFELFGLEQNLAAEQNEKKIKKRKIDDQADIINRKQKEIDDVKEQHPCIICTIYEIMLQRCQKSEAKFGVRIVDY